MRFSSADVTGNVGSKRQGAGGGLIDAASFSRKTGSTCPFVSVDYSRYAGDEPPEWKRVQGIEISHPCANRDYWFVGPRADLLGHGEMRKQVFSHDPHLHCRYHTSMRIYVTCILAARVEDHSCIRVRSIFYSHETLTNFAEGKWDTQQTPLCPLCPQP